MINITEAQITVVMQAGHTWYPASAPLFPHSPEQSPKHSLTWKNICLLVLLSCSCLLANFEKMWTLLLKKEEAFWCSAVPNLSLGGRATGPGSQLGKLGAV